MSNSNTVLLEFNLENVYEFAIQQQMDDQKLTAQRSKCVLKGENKMNEFRSFVFDGVVSGVVWCGVVYIRSFCMCEVNVLQCVYILLWALLLFEVV